MADTPRMTDTAATWTSDNPFSSPSELPFEAPAFDQIREEHYLPAFEAGMQQHLTEVRAIAENPDAPTFENTVEAMERFAAERGVTYELWRDPEFALTNALEIVGYPVTYFVSADGEILRQTGEIDAAELRETIQELF